MSVFYLQGTGTRQDAIFIVNNSVVNVVAEVGLTGCVDEPAMPIAQARKLWKNLIIRGFKRVEIGRRSAVEISRDIRD